MQGRMTEAELLQEVRQWANVPAEREPGVFTAREIAEAISRSEKSTRRYIRRWVEAGKLRPEKVCITNIVGVTTTVWGYRFAED